jgi:predicted CopG family antitoxin
MKTITINVSDPVYREFQEYAQKADRSTSELIREAMQLYRDERIRPRHSLRDLKPLALGKVLRPLKREDDLLDEMLDG